MRALARFGAPLENLRADDFMRPEMIVQIGVEPSRIDIITSIDGVDFDEAWKNKVSVTIDELEVFILSKAHLLRNKLATNRDKDQGDISWLKKS